MFEEREEFTGVGLMSADVKFLAVDDWFPLEDDSCTVVDGFVVVKMEVEAATEGSSDMSVVTGRSSFRATRNLRNKINQINSATMEMNFFYVGIVGEMRSKTEKICSFQVKQFFTNFGKYYTMCTIPTGQGNMRKSLIGTPPISQFIILSFESISREIYYTNTLKIFPTPPPFPPSPFGKVVHFPRSTQLRLKRFGRWFPTSRLPTLQSALFLSTSRPRSKEKYLIGL